VELRNPVSVKESAFESHFRESFEAGDHAAVIAAIPALQRMPESISLIPLVLKAAMRTNSIQDIEAAVSLAIQADSSPQERATHALLLARGSFMTEAFIVLLADANVRWFPDHVNLVTPVLTMLKRSMNKSLPAARAAIKFESSLKQYKLVSASNSAAKKIEVLSTKSNLGFPTSVRELTPKFLGPPTILEISDESLEVQRETFARGLQQAEEKILQHTVPNVSEFQDVFFNRFGDIWKEDGTVLKAVSNRVNARKYKSISLQHHDVLIAACAVESSKNPYLWCTRILPSLAWRWDLLGADVPIGISDTARPWVAESIRMAASEPPTISEVGDAVFVKRLIVPGWHMHFLARHEAYSACFERILKRAAAKAAPFNANPIYISRRDSQRRSMLNEIQLEEALARRGVEIVVLTGRTLSEKINLFRNAPLIIGAHGAGFGNLVFARVGRKVVEILPTHTPLTHHRVNMPNLSRIMGHEHHHYLALPARAYDDDSWELNLDDFLRFLDGRFDLK